MQGPLEGLPRERPSEASSNKWFHVDKSAAAGLQVSGWWTAWEPSQSVEGGACAQEQEAAGRRGAPPETCRVVRAAPSAPASADPPGDGVHHDPEGQLPAEHVLERGAFLSRRPGNASVRPARQHLPGRSSRGLQRLANSVPRVQGGRSAAVATGGEGRSRCVCTPRPRRRLCLRLRASPASPSPRPGPGSAPSAHRPRFRSGTLEARRRPGSRHRLRACGCLRPPPDYRHDPVLSASSRHLEFFTERPPRAQPGGCLAITKARRSGGGRALFWAFLPGQAAAFRTPVKLSVTAWRLSPEHPAMITCGTCHGRGAGGRKVNLRMV